MLSDVFSSYKCTYCFHIVWTLIDPSNPYSFRHAHTFKTQITLLPVKTSVSVSLREIFSYLHTNKEQEDMPLSCQIQEQILDYENHCFLNDVHGLLCFLYTTAFA